MNTQYEFLKLAADRYSVRKFADKPVEPQLVDMVLEAGRLAPTACNWQPQRVLVIRSKEAVAAMKRCTKCHFDAPMALLVCSDTGKCWKRPEDGRSSSDVDAAIVTTHMMLAAHSLGLGTTWVMYFIPEALREEFHIPETLDPVALLVMGYPAPDAKPYPAHLQSKSIEELVSYDSF